MIKRDTEKEMFQALNIAGYSYDEIRAFRSSCSETNFKNAAAISAVAGTANDTSGTVKDIAIRAVQIANALWDVKTR